MGGGQGGRMKKKSPSPVSRRDLVSRGGPVETLEALIGSRRQMRIKQFDSTSSRAIGATSAPPSVSRCGIPLLEFRFFFLVDHMEFVLGNGERESERGERELSVVCNRRVSICLSN